jgi:ParB-like chromosome segregation protein Spo0J
VPVIELAHLTTAQKRALVIADNRLALDAGWDEEMLALELADLSEAGYDLALTGFEDAEIEALLADDVLTPTEPRRKQTLTSRTLPTMCRTPSWRCRARAMSGPSARTA